MKRMLARTVLTVFAAISVLVWLPSPAQCGVIQLKGGLAEFEGSLVTMTDDYVTIKLAKQCIEAIELTFSGSSSYEDVIKMTGDVGKVRGKVIAIGPDHVVLRLPKQAIEYIKVETYDEVTTMEQKEAALSSTGLPYTGLAQEAAPSSSISLYPEGRPSAKTALEERLDALSREIESLKRKEAVADERIEAKIRESTRGTIEGRVLKGGIPLPACEVMVVRVIDSSPLWAALSQKVKDTEDDETRKYYLAKTDQHGMYAFRDIPEGQYDIYWRPAGAGSWVRRLREFPDVALLRGRTVHRRDIEVMVGTIN